MKPIDPFAESVRATLEEAAAPRMPDYLEDVLGRTARARQRPAWTFAGTWIPAMPSASPMASPMFRLALLVLLLVALLGAAAVIGQQLLERRLPEPYGLARNGLLAFESGKQIFLADADGTNARRLDAGQAMSTQPTWSPDGRLLAFFTTPDQWSPWSLFVTEVEGNGKIIADEVAPQRVGDTMVYGSIAWAPDSTQIAIQGGRQQVVVLNADGSDFRVLGDHLGLWRSHPAWSPDGSWIAFKGRPMTEEAVSAYGPGAGLFLIRPDGSGEQRLPTSAGSEIAFEALQWSPDGSRIAYHFGGPIRGTGEVTDTGYGVATIDVRTGHETILLNDVGHEYFPTYLPSGDAVAFLERSYPPLQDQAVWIMGEDGAEARRLEVAAAQSPFVCVSPDERFMLVEVMVGEQEWELQVVPLDEAATPDSAIRTALPGLSTSACWQRLPL